jgi:hypothetical protein
MAFTGNKLLSLSLQSQLSLGMKRKKVRLKPRERRAKKVVRKVTVKRRKKKIQSGSKCKLSKKSETKKMPLLLKK